MAHNVKTMITWEAGCIEILAVLKGKCILLRSGAKYTKRISVISAIYDGPSPSETIIFIRKGSANSVVVCVGDTWEYSLYVDEQCCQLAAVVCREHGAVRKQVCW